MRSHAPLWLSVALATVVLLAPIAAYAALVNINTADLTTLETLPGIGASKGQAIIDYRTQHGPFAAIADIQNVSGIGPATYANLQALITVSDSSGSSGSSGMTATSTTTAATSTSSSSSASTYTPPPSTLSLDIAGAPTALLEVPSTFTATAKMRNGAVDLSALITWSFGDGSGGEGTVVSKVYEHPGTYLVVARARDGDATAQADLTVTTASATLALPSVSNEGITIANTGSVRLDLSGWRLFAGTGSFRLPEGTMLLPGGSVLFPYTITSLPVSFDTWLAYPNNIVAVRYTPPAPPAEAVAQPPAPNASSPLVQTVVSALTSPSAPAHDPQAIAAPNAQTAAALGALMPEGLASSTPVEPASAHSPLLSGLLHSRWALGAIGVFALLGGAVMIL